MDYQERRSHFNRKTHKETIQVTQRISNPKKSRNQSVVNTDFEQQFLGDSEFFCEESSVPPSYYQEYHDEDEEEEEHLLCEVCGKVYSFTAFQQHLPKCGYRSQQEAMIRDLLKKKNEIKNQINTLASKDK